MKTLFRCIEAVLYAYGKNGAGKASFRGSYEEEVPECLQRQAKQQKASE